MLLSLAAGTNTFLNGVSAPVLESTGDLLTTHNAIVGGTLTCSSRIQSASVVAGAGVAPSEPSASAVGDLECANLFTHTVRAPMSQDLVLQANTGPVLRVPSSGGVTIAGNLSSTGVATAQGVSCTGGRGRDGTGANLRACGAGDLVYNPSALFFGGNNVDLHIFELSWLVFANCISKTRALLGHRQWASKAQADGGSYKACMSIHSCQQRRWQPCLLG